MSIEAKFEEFLKPLLGDMTGVTIRMQKEKLGFQGELTEDQHRQLISEIGELCRDLAGEGMARYVSKGLLAILAKAQ